MYSFLKISLDYDEKNTVDVFCSFFNQVGWGMMMMMMGREGGGQGRVRRSLLLLLYPASQIA